MGRENQTTNARINTPPPRTKERCSRFTTVDSPAGFGLAARNSCRRATSHSNFLDHPKEIAEVYKRGGSRRKKGLQRLPRITSGAGRERGVEPGIESVGPVQQIDEAQNVAGFALAGEVDVALPL